MYLVSEIERNGNYQGKSFCVKNFPLLIKLKTGFLGDDGLQKLLGGG